MSFYRDEISNLIENAFRQIERHPKVSDQLLWKKALLYRVEQACRMIDMEIQEAQRSPREELEEANVN